MTTLTTNIGSTTVAFDGSIFAVDKGCWARNGGSWSSVTKLQEVQASARQKLGLGSGVNAWIAMVGELGFCLRVREWLTDRIEVAPVAENKNELIAVIVTSEAKVYLLTGWYSLVKIDSVPFAEGSAHEMVLGAMLGGAKAPMAIALAARRSAGIAAGIDYVTIENGEFGGIVFDHRFTEQKMM